MNQRRDGIESAAPNPSCVFVAASNPGLRSHAEALEADGTLGAVHFEDDPSALLTAVEAHQPAILVVDLGDDPEVMLDRIEKLPEPRPGLLMLGSPEQGRTVLRAMRMGVREFFEELPSEDHLRGVLAELAGEILLEPEPEKNARVVAVMGAKGGIGATFVACQLARSLHAGGKRTAVVDLNLPLGDVALYFDVQPAHTVADIAQQAQQLDATCLATLLQGPEDGVRVLAAPTRAEEAELVRGEHVESVVELLRQSFDWVILDVSRIFGEPTVRALDLADQILMVTQGSVSTLHHTRQLLDLLERLGHDEERVRLIANSQAADASVNGNEAAEFLGREFDFIIPGDAEAAGGSIDHCASIEAVAPRSAITRALVELHRNLYLWADRKPPAARPPGVLARAAKLFRRS